MATFLVVWNNRDCLVGIKVTSEWLLRPMVISERLLVTRLVQAELSQALHTSGHSPQPAVSTCISSSCSVSSRGISSAGQSLTSAQRVIQFVSSLF